MNTLLQLFRPASQSDSCSDTGSENQNQKRNTEEAISMPSGNAGLQVLNQHSPRTQIVAQVAINKILTKSHFSICEVNSVMDLLNLGSRKSQAYKELHALHCVDYADMPANLRNQIPLMINELLTQSINTDACTNVALNGVFK